MKELKTPEELIEIMKNNGIRFNIVNEEKSKDFLAEHNYYYKVSAYRKNYEKKIYPDSKQKYVSLEFAYLQELSTIDMYLRYLIMKICLDIEHFLKVNIMKHIEDNPQENGYIIVKKYLTKYPNIWREIKRNKNNSYCKDLIDKHSNIEIPVWVLIELISFGNLVQLLRIYDNTYKGSFRKHKMLFNVKKLRNAAAHSNCLLNQLYKGEAKPIETIRVFSKKYSTAGNTMINTKLSNQVIHDFITMLYVFDNVVKSNKVKRNRYKELNQLFSERMLKNKEFFVDNEAIKTAYKFSAEIVDNLYKKTYNINMNKKKFIT